MKTPLYSLLPYCTAISSGAHVVSGGTYAVEAVYGTPCLINWGG